jgi:hypothetical protein
VKEIALIEEVTGQTGSCAFPNGSCVLIIAAAYVAAADHKYIVLVIA